MKRYLSVEHGWEFVEATSLRRRELSNMTPGSFCLLPGGRWLLVGSSGGAVYCYDLDCPNFTSSCLIEAQDRWSDQEVYALTFRTREGSECLGLDLMVEMVYSGERVALLQPPLSSNETFRRIRS